MKRVFTVLVLLVLCIAALGFYKGWFRFSSTSSGGKSDVTLTVDKDQIARDKEKAVDKVQGTGGNQPK
jgi:hypothetical protein